MKKKMIRRRTGRYSPVDACLRLCLVAGAAAAAFSAQSAIPIAASTSLALLAK
jgi:hypothetical protein